MGNKGKYTQPKILNDLRLGDPVMGPGPKKALFGSDRAKKQDLSGLPVMQKAEHKWDVYKEYNENIDKHPAYVGKFIPRDNHILIKCYKFESDNTTESGLILQNDFEWYETPGGQKQMRTSVNPYQRRAVIVRKGALQEDNAFHAQLHKGTTVILSTSKLDGAKFDTEPSKKGSNDMGYFLVHVGLIVGIESK